MKRFSDLTVGSKISNTIERPQYGTYSNMVIVDIRTTKTGRIMASYSYTFTHTNGETKNGTETIANGAVKPNTTLLEHEIQIIAGL